MVLSIVESSCSSLLANLQIAGWVTSHHLLGVDEWRYSWETQKEEEEEKEEGTGGIGGGGWQGQ